MSVIIQRSLSCINENAEDMPNVLQFELTDDLVTLIKSRRKVVNELGIYCTEEWSGAADYFYCDDGLAVFEEHDHDETEAELTPAEDFRSECDMLVVTSTSFCFQCVPKYLGEEYTLRCNHIYYRELEQFNED